VEECIKAIQHKEAIKYITKCDPAVRPGLYIKIGDFKAAGQEALALKDIQLLRFVIFFRVNFIILYMMCLFIHLFISGKFKVNVRTI
jgi:hypothetical protein